MADYIKDVRAKTGHMPLILNAAGGLVLSPDHRKILLQERADGGWCVPGGYLEYGESYAEAVVREMKEDSGLDVSIVRRLGTFDDHYYMNYPNGDKVMNIAVAFLVKPIGGGLDQADPKETKRLQYFPLDQLPPIIFKQNADMVDYLKSLLAQGKI